jgi:hypothetical protein
MKFLTVENTRFSKEFFLKYTAMSNAVLWDNCYITVNQWRIFALWLKLVYF